MNQAMPDWRSFGTEETTTGPDGTHPPQKTAAAARSMTTLVVAGLTVTGGALLGAALVALALVLLTTSGVPPATAPELGLPLDALPVEPQAAEGAVAPPPTTLVVDVAGAVVRPGLHRLQPGDRVGDAIATAGGYGPRADLAAAAATLNLARPLEDGTKVLVPELGNNGAGAAEAPDDGRIDLNEADQSELETLPGVGPVTARKIIDARVKRRFGSVRELRSRGLVGDAVFEDVEEMVRVRG